MQETNEEYLDRAMGRYTNAKQRKVVTQKELDDKKHRSEWSIQLRVCKWLKSTYPEIRFRSDIQSAGKLSPGMQNIKQIIDPWRSWPDIAIYAKRGKYIGLHIELKREGSGTFLKDGSLSRQEHVQEQAEMHGYLRSIGYAVAFAEGEEMAKKYIEKYLSL
jgi:hypothetical protein